MNRRRLITAASATGALALAGGGAWWYLREDEYPKGASDRVDLLAGAYSGLAYQGDPELFAMLSLEGGMPGRTTMVLRLFDLDAAPLADTPEITATVANLVTDEQSDLVDVVAQEDGSWELQQSAIESDGWWQIVVTLDELTASWTFLMPDPNLTGFDTPPTIDAEPDASATLAAAINALSNHTSLRWWQWLSGGNGAIILSNFSVTTPESNDLPAAFESDAVMAGRIPLDGTEASFRAENDLTVSTEDGALRSTNGGTPEPSNKIQYLPIDQYHTTYEGYEGAHFGSTAYIEGRRCQLVAFFLPGLQDAWFAFWIDIETTFVREIFMLSVNHYMHWVYYDIDEPFELGF